jgi:N-terminal domain of anti-restriction factor ArdC
MTATARGYACPIWLTYKQAQELGAQVRKGEHGELVVYANRITRTETAATGEETEREIPFLKGYTVFNAEQIDKLPPHFTTPAAPTLDPVARITHAESFFANTKADIRHGGNQAYFAISPTACRCRRSRPAADVLRSTVAIGSAISTARSQPGSWCGFHAPPLELLVRARAQKIKVAHAERSRQLIERHDGRVAPTLLQAADVLLTEARHLGELLLRQALLPPDAPNIPPDLIAHVHAPKVSG